MFGCNDWLWLLAIDILLNKYRTTTLLHLVSYNWITTFIIIIHPWLTDWLVLYSPQWLKIDSLTHSLWWFPLLAAWVSPSDGTLTWPYKEWICLCRARYNGWGWSWSGMWHSWHSWRRSQVSRSLSTTPQVTICTPRSCCQVTRVWNKWKSMKSKLLCRQF